MAVGILGENAPRHPLSACDGTRDFWDSGSQHRTDNSSRVYLLPPPSDIRSSPIYKPAGGRYMSLEVVEVVPDDQKETMSESVLLRLTPSELAAIDEARGEEERSAWIRRLCRGGAKVIRLRRASVGAPWTSDEMPDIAHFINWCAQLDAANEDEAYDGVREVAFRAEAIQRIVGSSNGD